MVSTGIMQLELSLIHILHPKELQKLLEKIDGTSEEPLISRLTLRSMKQARYTVERVPEIIDKRG